MLHFYDIHMQITCTYANLIIICILKVNELSGGTKNQKKGSKDTGPQYCEICDSCKPYIEAGEELPLPLLAQLIKFRLLMIKEADRKRREDESKVKQYAITVNLAKIARYSVPSVIYY